MTLKQNTAEGKMNEAGESYQVTKRIKIKKDGK